MKKFQPRAVIIRAMQFTGENYQEILDMVPNSSVAYDENNVICLFINTLEGRMKANLNDWIIEGLRGEYYPCKPDIFSITYEKFN